MKRIILTIFSILIIFSTYNVSASAINKNKVEKLKEQVEERTSKIKQKDKITKTTITFNKYLTIEEFFEFVNNSDIDITQVTLRLYNGNERITAQFMFDSSLVQNISDMLSDIGEDYQIAGITSVYAKMKPENKTKIKNENIFTIDFAENTEGKYNSPLTWDLEDFKAINK